MLRNHSHEPFLAVSPVIQPALTCLFSYLFEPADTHTEGSLAVGFSLSSPSPSPPVCSQPQQHQVFEATGELPQLTACLWPLRFLPVLLMYLLHLKAWLNQEMHLLQGMKSYSLESCPPVQGMVASFQVLPSHSHRLIKTFTWTRC